MPQKCLTVHTRDTVRCRSTSTSSSRIPFQQASSRWIFHRRILTLSRGVLSTRTTQNSKQLDPLSSEIAGMFFVV